MRYLKKIKTEPMKYPCPNCGRYELPYMHTKTGYAYMLCSKCKTQYKTSTKVSASFRKFCSKLGSKPNRSQGYYTSGEERIRQYLIRRGLLEGYDFIHNSRIYNKETKNYIWVDFFLPRYNRPIFICYNPDVWHKLWGREKSDKIKLRYLKKLGKVVVLKDKIMKRKYLTPLFDNLLSENK